MRCFKKLLGTVCKIDVKKSKKKEIFISFNTAGDEEGGLELR